MHAAHRCRHRASQAEKSFHLHRLVQQAYQRLPALVLQHQDSTPTFPYDIEWQQGPCTLQLLAEFMLVGKAVEARACGVLSSEGHGQHGTVMRERGMSPAARKDAIVVLEQHLHRAGTLNGRCAWAGRAVV